MTYRSKEDSLYDGEPIELYRIVLGGTTYLLTNSQSTFKYQNNPVEKVHIKHSNIKDSDSKKKANITITLPTSHKLIKLLLTDPPDDVMMVSILRRHEGDDQWVTYWRGTGGTVRDGELTSTIECHNLIIATTRAGLRAKYNHLCPHSLYDANSCRASKSAKTVAIGVTAVAGKSVTATGLMAGITAPANLKANWFVGGQLTFGQYRRFIQAQSGDTLVLEDPIPGLVAGSNVTIVAGCDRTMSQCRRKFNNISNFGGFPTIPTKNPFAGDGIV